MKQFLKENRPTIVGMLKSDTADGIIAEIGRMSEDEPDAYGFQIEVLRLKDRNRDNYQRIFAAMNGKPSYVTHYARCNCRDFTDDELMRELYTAIECGATLVDVRCDLYDRRPDEFTTDTAAVKKQKEVIKTIHEMGAQVLMSAHTFKFLPPEKVLEIALAQQERGTDVIKIVTNADTEAELLSNFETSILLKERISTPALFLCNGDYCKKHRILGPVLGGCMYLSVENSRTEDNQPTVRRAKEQLTLAGYKF